MSSRAERRLVDLLPSSRFLVTVSSLHLFNLALCLLLYIATKEHRDCLAQQAGGKTTCLQGAHMCKGWALAFWRYSIDPAQACVCLASMPQVLPAVPDAAGAKGYACAHSTAGSVGLVQRKGQLRTLLHPRRRLGDSGWGLPGLDVFARRWAREQELPVSFNAFECAPRLRLTLQAIYTFWAQTQCSSKACASCKPELGRAGPLFPFQPTTRMPGMYCRRVFVDIL